MTRPSFNPFHHPDNPPRSALQAHAGPDGDIAGEAARVEVVERVDRVDQPWGHEEVFAVFEGRYVGKVLHVDAGKTLSLESHPSKDGTIAVLSGRVTVKVGADPARLRTLTLDAGDRLVIRANVVHRLAALTDAHVLEASAVRSGLMHNVVRNDHQKGRAGT